MLMNEKLKNAVASMKDAGMSDMGCADAFTKHVFSSVLNLLNIFFSKEHSPYAAEFILSLFDLLARGGSISLEFLDSLKAKLKALACDESLEKAEDAWIADRYGIPSKIVGHLVRHLRNGTEDKKSPLLPETFNRDGYGLVTNPPITCIPVIRIDGYGGPIYEPEKEENAGILPDISNEKEEEEEPMCLPDNDLVRAVRSTIDEKCEDMKLFTSVDISNAIKKSGKMVRHRDVAAVVRKMFTDRELDKYGYVREMITVTLPNSKSVQAWLYLHQTADSSDYDKRAQVAMPPVAQSVHPASAPIPSPKPVVVQTPIVTTTVDDGDGDSSQEMTIMPKYDGRIEIPRSWIRDLGWGINQVISFIKTSEGLELKSGFLTSSDVVGSVVIDRWRRIRVPVKFMTKARMGGGTRTVKLERDSITVK